MSGIRIRARSWKGGALQAATLIALAAGCSVSGADEAKASGPAPAATAQATTDDPCRYFTAEDMGKALGRPMKSSKLHHVCEYRSTGTGIVVVKVEAGPEGTLMRFAKRAAPPGQKAAEKISTAAGEAFFDDIIPAFIGRVGNHEVQIETTIEPLPRDAMIAVGTRIMGTLSRK